MADDRCNPVRNASVSIIISYEDLECCNLYSAGAVVALLLFDGVKTKVIATSRLIAASTGHEGRYWSASDGELLLT